MAPVQVSALAMPVTTHIREYRTERGWSQGDLADRAEVSRQTINSIETGKYEPSLSLALTLSRLFKVRVEDLFSLER